MPISKIDGIGRAELECGNIEKLFEEARQRTNILQGRWAKYYNRRRREANVNLKDQVLVRTHPMSSAYKKLVRKIFSLSLKVPRGCGSPEVNVSDHGRHSMSSSPVPLKTRRVGQRCTLNLSRAETSSRWCDVVVRRGGASSGVIHVT
ncbi:uncharacterized protein TNCV_3429221 [Trichonephila clavipes]|nr:uncharacterized protein TNCV_3429221 [Trichonephila clavipes]